MSAVSTVCFVNVSRCSVVYAGSEYSVLQNVSRCNVVYVGSGYGVLQNFSRCQVVYVGSEYSVFCECFALQCSVCGQ